MTVRGDKARGTKASGVADSHPEPLAQGADLRRRSNLRAADSAAAARVPAPGSAAAGTDSFGKFAARMSAWLGSKWAFAVAGLVIVVWAAAGPPFRYSDT